VLGHERLEVVRPARQPALGLLPAVLEPVLVRGRGGPSGGADRPPGLAGGLQHPAVDAGGHRQLAVDVALQPPDPVVQVTPELVVGGLGLRIGLDLLGVGWPELVVLGAGVGQRPEGGEPPVGAARLADRPVIALDHEPVRGKV
jgi:hypothetical protein